MIEKLNHPLTANQARKLEYSIIGSCLVALIFIFQPFSHTLFSIGCVGVIVGGLAFNLVPFCVAGTTIGQVAKVGLIVFITFCVVVLFVDF